MNEPRGNEVSVESSREIEDVIMEDLGDVKLETKQYFPFGSIQDHSMALGWG